MQHKITMHLLLCTQIGGKTANSTFKKCEVINLLIANCIYPE